MRNLKTILVFLVLTLCSKFSFGQDINADTTLANEYMFQADDYFESTIYDSAVYAYETASEIYWKYYQSTNEEGLLQNFIYCQNYFALNISVFGYTDTAFFILEKSKNLCQQQIKSNDECMSDYYFCYGTVNFMINDFPVAIEYFKKAIELQKNIYGENHEKCAYTYNFIGVVNDILGNYDIALEYYFKTISIYDKLKTYQQNKARTLENIGIVYKAKGEFELALDYYEKSLKMKKDLHGLMHKNVAQSYNNLAILYYDIGDFDLALEYLNDAVRILKELYGNKHYLLCDAYTNTGNAYYRKGESDLALEYYNKSLLLTIEFYGVENKKSINLYNNIGNIYSDQGKSDEALKSLLKSLDLTERIFGKDNLELAIANSNIGSVYYYEEKYTDALLYFNRALDIRLLNLGEEHYYTGKSYHSIGQTYYLMGELDSSLYYLKKAHDAYNKTFGSRHPDISLVYINFSEIYIKQRKYELALNHIQKSLISNFKYQNDNINIFKVPQLIDYFNWMSLIESMFKKAEILIQISNKEEYLLAALSHYQACDTLINQVRQSINTKSDKLAIGEYSDQVYQSAINVSLKLSEVGDRERGSYYQELAFYFSEKNKSSVLLEALAGAEAQKFAGISDTLLNKEHKLRIDIALYNKLLAEQPDSTKEILFRDKLFTANRQYDALIQTFENDYSSYFELKYNREPASVEDIQKLLDNNTAMISYFTGDSAITIFTITKKDLDIKTVLTIENLADTIRYFRNGLIYTNSSRFSDFYKQQAYKFYKQLIPENINKKIENLIIIPDAELSMIPFETLLTEEAGDKDWSELPYLIKKYNISYSYSANLFYKTFPKEPAGKVETSDLKDWLAFAPVFDDSNTSGLTLRTRELLRDFDANINDTVNTRGRLVDGAYISPLPGTESEVKAIFKEFDEKGRKAQVLMKKNANEEFVKQGGLKDYKLLHFATHGFVNTEKPELSGIFLAQDSTASEDGILFSGEIYNLGLNADLTVLSACETGLGEIKKGEGLIGLTRALLYAGSKNIIVSLWKVADESTSDLMIDFYKNLLEENQKNMEFSKALQKAKIKMIDEGTYAHPFYWSPFILIGK